MTDLIMKIIFTIISSLLFLAPSLSLACTVCFGGADADLVNGFTWGIILLLALTFGMMAWLVGYVAYNTKKKKAHE